MKLNWFAPLPTITGRPGECLAPVLSSLCARAEVVLWADQPTKLPSGLPAEVRRFRPGAVPWAEVQRAELSIYHLADNAEYGGIWEVSRRHPGLVVLHDVALPRLFLSHFRQQAGGERAYRMALERYYGDVGRRLAPLFWDGRVGVDFVTDRYPHTELAVEGALGVMVPTRAAYDALRPMMRWPLAYQPLPARTDQGEAYTDGLLRLCDEAQRWRARALTYPLAERMAAEISTWAGRYGEVMSERVAEAIVSLV
jgi:hypothetical protein